jgi:creatinine amidohydrolase
MRRPPAVLLLTRYSPAMVTAYPAPNTWIAYPFPSSIGLYKEGEGHPRFDAAQAKTYFTPVTDKVAGLVQDTIRKWDDAGL